MLLRFILETICPVEYQFIPENGDVGSRTPVLDRLLPLVGAIPELGFEPRRTPSKGADLPVSRFWII